MTAAKRINQGLLSLRTQLTAWPLLALFLLWGAFPAAGQISHQIPFNPDKQFTILQIEPDAAKEEIRIVFSQPIPLDVLRTKLTLAPPVRIHWDKSSVSDEGVVTLRGALKYGTNYLINLPDTFTYNQRTYVKTRNSFFLPDMLPKAEFVDQKSVIERDSRQLLQVRVRNLESVLVAGLKVPPLLLPLALAAESRPDRWPDLLPQLQAGVEALQPLASGFLPIFLTPPREDRQLFNTQGQKNKPRAFSLPLTFRPDKETGALELIQLSAGAPERQAAGPSQLFRLTDMGLTSKVGDQGLLLWVTSLKSGAPVAGAQVLGFTREMEVFPLGQTNADGILTFSSRELEGLNLKQAGNFGKVKRLVDHRQLSLLMAGTTSDVSYIALKGPGSLTPDGIWQVEAGEPIKNRRGYVFTDRGVYRPGEKVSFKGMVREYQDGAIVPPRQGTYRFVITSPKGEEIYSREVALSEFGGAWGELDLQPHLPRGTYTLALKLDNYPATAAPKPVDEETEPFAAGPAPDGGSGKPPEEATCTFQVQDFKPPRHYVEISFQRFSRPEDRYVNRPGTREFVRFTISGSYYAGGPVKHGQVRWKVNTAKTSFQVPGFDDYTFGCQDFDKPQLLESGQAILDEKGQAVVEFPLEAKVLAGLQGLAVTATVVDFDGRSVSSSKDFQVDPEILVGISSHRPQIRAGDEQALKAIVTHKGKKISQGKIRAEVLQQSSTYVAKRNEQGDVYWDYQEIWRKLFTNELPLKKGEAELRFDFSSGGDYLVSFTYVDERGRSFASSTNFRVTGDFYWSDYENRERPYRLLAISADQPAYEPGQRAKIMVSPRRPVSRYLITLEQNGVLEYFVLAAPAGLQLLEIPIKSAYAPNVYVSILGLTARGDFPAYASRYDSEAPDFFWGNLNLPVRRQAERLEVKISPQIKELKAEPGASVELAFTVQGRDGQGVEAEMAVAVVDERILALTAFKTPDPESLILFNRPLGVFTGELRTLLMQQTPFSLARSEPLTGGGGLEPGAEAVMGKVRQRFDPCAYFNPALRTDHQGQAKVSFTLPDTMTTYRVYTVVLDRTSRLASAERPFLVTKDFYLEPGLPAFFTQGDRFRFQVAAFNDTAARGLLTLQTTTEGGLKLSPVTPKLELPAKDSLKAEVAGEALAPGPALARFRGDFQGKQDAVEESLTINSGQVLETTVSFGSPAGSTEVRLTLPPWVKALDPAQTSEVKAVLTLAGSPFLRMTEAIHYLLRYPYGCVEQVSSGVLGLAALRGAILDGLVPGVTLAETDAYLTRGLGRILGMQLDSGGFSYWPSQEKVHPWGTIYAAMALNLAQTKGLEVPKGALEKANAYLREQVLSRRSPDLLRAFGVYILSLTKSLDRDAFQAVRQIYPRLSREGKILVLLAGKQANLMSAKELQDALKPGTTEKTGEAAEDDFQARYRAPALALLAGTKLMPQDPFTEQAALALLGGLDAKGAWTSTADTGWALLALSEYFRGRKFDTAPVELAVDQPGSPRHRLTLDPRSFRTLSLDPQLLLKNPAFRLELPTRSTVLYKMELTAPRADLAAAGIEHGLKVWKTIQNTDGTSEIKVGDLVKVTVHAQIKGKDQRYLVLDDPLPAGLVAVNTAFATEAKKPNESGENQDNDDFEYVTPEGNFRLRPDFFEIRRDRVLAFKDYAYSGNYLFEYYARAVCAGDFVQPATKAAAMYNPQAYGYSPKGALTIKSRQP